MRDETATEVQRRLSQTSRSPFPSPGSPFLPPPKLGAHEFASKLPHVSQPMHPAANEDELGLDASKQVVIPSPTEAVSISPSLSVPTLSVASPTTPTPNASFNIRPATPPTAPAAAPGNSDAHLSSLSARSSTAAPPPSRESLTSSRPAPPSPAVSRRTSAALSRHSSSAKSRRQSRVPPQSSIQEAVPSSSAATITPAAPSTLKVRDFAFPPSDERHVGRGPDVPRPNRVRNRQSTASSEHNANDDDDDDADESKGDEHGGWPSFRWNTLSRHFSWNKSHDTNTADDDAGGPSHTDFARNFDAITPTTEDVPYPLDEDAQDEGDAENDEELAPGLYKALYAFEPEGTAEMALAEEQVVRVLGRGGGVGWAVVESEDGGHALVPESYLELVQLDTDVKK